LHTPEPALFEQRNLKVSLVELLAWSASGAAASLVAQCPLVIDHGTVEEADGSAASSVALDFV
jgi:hypothetical protein